MNDYGTNGTKGQRRVAKLAEDKGLHLFRGTAFGCGYIHADDGKAWKPYSITRDDPRPGSDPKMLDSYLVLCRVTLAEAETYLTDDTVPEGHTLYELSPYELADA